jgi:hypothetical protein
MTRMMEFRALLCTVTAFVWALGAQASPAKSLRLVADFAPPYEDLDYKKAPGFSVEVLRQVFAGIAQEVSLEAFPIAGAGRWSPRAKPMGFSAARAPTSGTDLSLPGRAAGS